MQYFVFFFLSTFKIFLPSVQKREGWIKREGREEEEESGWKGD
jgi:hypothetical protein